MDNLYIHSPVSYNLVVGTGTLNPKGLSNWNLIKLFIHLKLGMFLLDCGINLFQRQPFKVNHLASYQLKQYRVSTLNPEQVDITESVIWNEMSGRSLATKNDVCL